MAQNIKAEKITSTFDASEEQNRLRILVEDIISQAKSLGADACEVGANSNMGLSATVRMGEVEMVEFNRDQGFSITVYSGKCKGSASTTDTSSSMVKATVEAACNIARYTQEDNCAGLADANKMATSFPELDLYHPWGIDSDAAIELATTCEQAARDVSHTITNSDGATITSHQGCSVYGNSHGFIGGTTGSRHSASCVVIAQKDDEMQRDYWYSTARDPSSLENMQEIGRTAARRTLERLGGKKVRTGSYPIIFQSDIASSLIGHFTSAVSGGNLYRDSSFLKGALGEQIFPKWMHIHENPYLLKGFSSGSYDGDGLQTQAKDFVSNGVLSSYILSTYSGRKLGMESTANSGGVRNLFVDSNAGGMKELLQTMGTGLLATEFLGSSVNIVTGDYSRGVSGFWVENGEIVHPVAEVTVAGNLKDMFAGIVQVGNDVDLRGSIYTGSILLERMMIAGE